MLGPSRRGLVLALVAALLGAGLANDDGAVVLDLDTLEARMDGSTLHAREIAGAHVGAIDDEVFLAIVVGDAGDGATAVRGYLCGREEGVWLRGERAGDEVTLSSADGVVRIEGTMSGGDVFGVARFGDAEPHPFTAAPARGDAGLYRAEARLGGEDRVAGWVVLEDGRQRGGLDGKGNDVYPPPARN